MSEETLQKVSLEERTVRESQVVCRAVFALQKDLGLNTEDLESIFCVDGETIGRWEYEGAIPNLSGRLRQATSHLIAVHRNLLAMFADPTDRKLWIRSEHMELVPAPIELMRELEGLVRVRRYLDYARERGA
jgi:hypothetical protein